MSNQDTQYAIKLALAEKCIQDNLEPYIIHKYDINSLLIKNPYNENEDYHKPTNSQELQPGVSAMLSLELTRINGDESVWSSNHWQFSDVRTIKFGDETSMSGELIIETGDEGLDIENVEGFLYSTIDFSEQYKELKRIQRRDEIEIVR